MTHGQPIKPGSGDAIHSPLDVHIAEYAALTMRNTNWITLQYAIYALAAAYLSFVIQAKSSLATGRLVWVSLLVLQMLAWAMLQTQFEIFVNVAYLERHLKPKVQKLIGGSACWEYETFIGQRRASGFTRFEWRFGLLGFFLLVASGVAWLVYRTIVHTHWTMEDAAWVLVNAYISVLVVGRVIQNLKMQRYMLGDEPDHVKSRKVKPATA
jgi:hypothetical protein